MASVKQGSKLIIRSDIAPSPSQRRHWGSRSSPVPSAESDKENAGNHTTRSSLGKRKSTSNNMSTQQPSENAASTKRRRTENRSQPSASRRKELSQRVTYDPDQDEATKRGVTKQYRELHATLNDSRAEFLARGSTGIQDTIRRADEYIKDVKQTSTATIDSRLLVNVGDLAQKKINTMTLGDSSTAIDVDDFLTKCISYMSPAAGTGSISTQRRRQRRQMRNEEDDEDEDEEHADLNWSHFGRTLCFPASSRPCLSSFLLGPLSVQKKHRAQTQRRATQRANVDPSQATRPLQLDQETREQQDAQSLTETCAVIAKQLRELEEEATNATSREVEMLPEDLSEEEYENEVRLIMWKHNIRSNGGVPLFHFCVNPASFGQTVENFFYVSFLVKEGKVGLSFDEDDMPTLSTVEQKSLAERQDSVRNQAVFTIDFDVYNELIESCGIKESIIKTRPWGAWEDDDGVLRTNLAGPPTASSISSDVAGGHAIAGDIEVEDNDLYGPG